MLLAEALEAPDAAAMPDGIDRLNQNCAVLLVRMGEDDAGNVVQVLVRANGDIEMQAGVNVRLHGRGEVITQRRFRVAPDNVTVRLGPTGPAIGHKLTSIFRRAPQSTTQ